MRWIPGSSGNNVEDRRGTRFSGGGGFGRLGIGGILVLGVLSLVFKKNFFALLGQASGETATTTEGPIASTPAEDSLVEFVKFVLNDDQTMWAQTLPAQTRVQYRDAKLVLFRDAVESACGFAQAASGPFYCPSDEKVYIDLGFYEELSSRFGASGDFAQAYVLAHEIGHHVQNQLGAFQQAQRGSGESGGAVRLELQADCYAGIWAATVRNRQLLDPGDIEEGLNAAASVGDDRIQQMSGRAINPESWTHGSASQRASWFRRGYETGQVAQCNTFAN